MFGRFFSWLWKHKVVAILILIGIAGGLAVYQRSRTAKPQYTTVHPTVADLSETLDVSGNVDAHEKADLHFAVPARLQWVGVKEGQTVKKYQAIATQDTKTLQKELQTSLNNFAKQFITHDQTLDQYHYYGDQGLTTDMKRILDKAQYDLNNSVIQVEISDLAIKLSTLSSPITGVVTKAAQPYAGSTIMPTDVFEVVNPMTVFFGSVVDESDIGKVKTGQAADIVLDAYPNETYHGTIDRIDFSPSVSESGGNGYKVYITLPVDNSSLNYKLGMSGTANIILSQKSQVFNVPLDSLISRDNADYVDVLVDGKPVRKEVKTGIQTESQVEIISGLSPNDLVIVPKK